MKKRPEYSNIGISAVIDEWIHSERDRKILKRKLIDGISFEQVAKEFGVDPKTAKRIVYKGENKIFTKI